MNTKQLTYPTIEEQKQFWIDKEAQSGSCRTTETREVTPFSHSKEFHDMRDYFEKTYSHLRLDRESKEMFSRKAFYECGETNDLFMSFMNGHQYGKTL